MKMSNTEALIRVARSNAEMMLPDALQACLRACFTLIEEGMPAAEVYAAVTAMEWPVPAEEPDVQCLED